MKTGILLLNLGGPDTLDAVRPFLVRLFSDREIIRLPGGPVGQWFIGRMIAIKRTKEVQENYHKIGGGSPIVCWSTLQGEGMVRRLRERGHDVEYALAMRYWNPTTDAALDRLESLGCDRLVALTMYPHYSVATTGSSMAELLRVMKRRKTRMPLTRIESWYDHPAYLDALSSRVRACLDTFPAGSRPTLLFSAHGLPKHFIDDGDPYCEHIRVTLEGIRARLPELPWTLGYQSRVGPVEWIGPSTEEVVDRLGREGVKDVLAVPISFVSDHIETLYEVDMLYGDQAKKVGIVNFRRPEGLNDFPPFLDALASVVEPALAASGEAILAAG
ncbi:MAG TPA: ferrochelatase [Candidatus Omnitrophota bacterium]|jgi:ferrochelatase|nr:ferrochelatase [Candidatus Omnitrophota bacterium]